MVSTCDEGLPDVKVDCPVNVTEFGLKDSSGKDAAFNASASRKALLGNGNSSSQNQDRLEFIPMRLSIVRSTSDGSLPSLSASFRKMAEERNEMSRSVPSSSSQGVRQRFSGILAQKIDWALLWNICRNWIKNPFNMALFTWIICVAVSGAILFLVMTGILNNALPKKSQRDTWFEVNSQILNALFTLMCLYQHPKRIYHLVLLCRWKPKDITTLRKLYCKNGTYKPHEWANMMVVVALLHINCFAQYALCSLNWGYKRSERPAIGVGICLSVAIAAPAIAGVYSILSPLGKEYESELDEEAPDKNPTVGQSSRRLSLEKRFSFASRNEERIIVHAPVWKGGLFDIWDNIVIAYLSLFCTFCVFGWNMERLGFGNMYVHIATFLLFCIAPFWIFNLAAINIDNETVRQALGLTGVVLCLLGLLYGGFWRIKMRRRFNLPANNACYGKPAIADFTQWLFCCWCSLAQEVRTADYYDIVENKFCIKQTDGINQTTLSPLPHDGVVQIKHNLVSPFRDSPGLSNLATNYPPSPSRFSKDYSPGRQLHRMDDKFSVKAPHEFTSPPVLSSVQSENNTDENT